MILELREMFPCRESCEELREAGFPQDAFYSWVRHPNGGDFVVGTADRLVRDGIARVIAAAPLVGEMREWLRRSVAEGYSYLAVQIGSDGTLYADVDRPPVSLYVTCETDAQAYAMACLALLRAMKEEVEG